MWLGSGRTGQVGVVRSDGRSDGCGQVGVARSSGCGYTVVCMGVAIIMLPMQASWSPVLRVVLTARAVE